MQGGSASQAMRGRQLTRGLQLHAHARGLGQALGVDALADAPHHHSRVPPILQAHHLPGISADHLLTQQALTQGALTSSGRNRALLSQRDRQVPGSPPTAGASERCLAGGITSMRPSLKMGVRQPLTLSFDMSARPHKSLPGGTQHASCLHSPPGSQRPRQAAHKAQTTLAADTVKGGVGLAAQPTSTTAAAHDVV